MRIDSPTFEYICYILQGLRATDNTNHGISSFFVLLLLSPTVQHAGAQGWSPQATDTDPNNNGKFSPSTGIIIIVFIAALFFMGFFSIYIRHCAEDSSIRSRNVVTGPTARSRRGPRGLDAAVIESFPKFAYSAVKTLKIGSAALECAVCLNEFEDDETLRLIPKCDHVFHPDCIDAWLATHTTCPVCRANLAPQSAESTHSPQGVQIDEHSHSQDDVVVEVPQECDADDNGDGRDIMERPLQAPEVVDVSRRLNRNRTRRNLSGRQRWFGRFWRSNSTGHLAVKQWENMERFTLRLPEEVRKQVISGKLNRSASCVVLQREDSSRRGYGAGYGEGSSRGRVTSARFDRGFRSNRWVFSLAQPFFSRAPSVNSLRVAAARGGGGSLHSPKTATFGSVHTPKGEAATIDADLEFARPPG
ncbi:hypothetical protein Nepgr_001536 [Nepenthes gracilis]|uniref:RING-type E3 ubiquitin transferase n=1 Tax=Nepenthes gracilis TaxID=150966 RepID=A0AAD3P5C7_NEPGR|nr:hypothetical protein Nepgr_001536 [Nepenthes gracilis]